MWGSVTRKTSDRPLSKIAVHLQRSAERAVADLCSQFISPELMVEEGSKCAYDEPFIKHIDCEVLSILVHDDRMVGRVCPARFVGTVSLL